VALRLRTVGGAEDLLRDEIRSLRPSRVRPGAVDLDPGPLPGWFDLLTEIAGRRFYSSAAMRIIGPPDGALIESAGRALSRFAPAPPRPDPDDAPNAQLIELAGMSWPARHRRLHRLPWSTSPALAEAMVRLAKVRPGVRVLDPCCGSGTILVAAALARAGYLYGYDHDPAATAAARSNLALFAPAARTDIRTDDAALLRLESGSVDRVISNLPFGKRVGTHRGNQRLYPALLAELGRVLTPDGRAVLLTEDKNLLVSATQRTPGIKIIRQRLFRYHGASPTAYVISRTRRG
jgi:SAM-dependent methyltransferase